MIIFYNKPNTLTLPYKVKKKQELFRFIPGINHISKETWLAIVNAAGNDMDYYKTLLKVFQPKIDVETKQEIGEEENKVDISGLKVSEMSELIENTMEKESLEEYYELEKKRDKPRTSITRLLKQKLEEISEVETALKIKEKS